MMCCDIVLLLCPPLSSPRRYPKASSILKIGSLTLQRGLSARPARQPEEDWDLLEEDHLVLVCRYAICPSVGPSVRLCICMLGHFFSCSADAPLSPPLLCFCVVAAAAAMNVGP
jgi:hypothetical protein